VEQVVSFIWGPPLLAAIVGTGVFLSIRLRFLPQRMLGRGIRSAFSRKKPGGAGDISPFSALMTSLASTIGTANIAGVATAMALGGPGAVFWMWLSALFGIATKYAEAALAVRFREKGADGRWHGGPMFALKNGVRRRWGGIAAAAYAVFTVIASFGIGNMAQSNSAADAMKTAFGVHPAVSGIAMAALCGMVLAGGLRSVARVASRVVPAMGALYILGGLAVIAMNLDSVGEGLAEIVHGAFTGRAAAGGFAGASAVSAMRYGVARGVFSSEAGLGSASIAAAAAKTDHPARQGLVSMTGVFIDTLVVCSITALVIASTGAWKQAGAAGAAMTVRAFGGSLGQTGEIIVALGLCLFAFSSILGWSVYGEAALRYLVPSACAAAAYRVVFCAAAAAGAVVPLKLVWELSDIANALMALPNLMCLLVLSGAASRDLRGFLKKDKKNHS